MLILSSVWRPLKEVRDWPLAVCDGSNVSYEDLVEADHVRRHYVGSTCNMMYNPDHRWHFLSKQRKGEVLLIKQFDSDYSIKAKGMHGASRGSIPSPTTRLTGG